MLTKLQLFENRSVRRLIAYSTHCIEELESMDNGKFSITKHSSALYIGMAKVLPIIDVLGYDGQNSFSSSSCSDSTPITQKGSHTST